MTVANVVTSSLTTTTAQRSSNAAPRSSSRRSSCVAVDARGTDVRWIVDTCSSSDSTPDARNGAATGISTVRGPRRTALGRGPERRTVLDARHAHRTVGDVGNAVADTDKQKVLVVEDDPNTREAIVAALRWAGFLCTEAADAARARHIIANHRPDLVVLDLGLPDSDGLELLSELRRNDDIPIVVCSGRDSELDRVGGLDVGADDYVTKPFSPRELALRVRSVLRRVGSVTAAGLNVLSFGEVTIDVDAHEVTKAGKPLSLTAREFDLLVFLARNQRIAFTRAQLLKNVWRNAEKSRTEATVTEHVRRLRRKIGDSHDNPRHLCAVRGVGYRLVP
ncbi:MAG: response regulator transcription factor [Acidobacteria bacterium]|nr:response regulator transcription factor [Acidobacteriota bacterium]